MKSCSTKDFMEELSPWLDERYVSEVHRDSDGNVVLVFQDGVRNVYRIEDCTGEQLEKLLADLRGRGVKVL